MNNVLRYFDSDLTSKFNCLLFSRGNARVWRPANVVWNEIQSCLVTYYNWHNLSSRHFWNIQSSNSMSLALSHSNSVLVRTCTLSRDLVNHSVKKNLVVTGIGNILVLNNRIQGHLFTSHWITKVPMVLCLFLQLQMVLTHVNDWSVVALHSVVAPHLDLTLVYCAFQ